QHQKAVQDDEYEYYDNFHVCVAAGQRCKIRVAWEAQKRRGGSHRATQAKTPKRIAFLPKLCSSVEILLKVSRNRRERDEGMKGQKYRFWPVYEVFRKRLPHPPD
ncbi:MAG TPA: hypothetical protein PKD78_15065, partial [Saprospiraceae bacterium]|nr:hypothetical protein [Saprospiraceae bacterium]